MQVQNYPRPLLSIRADASLRRRDSPTLRSIFLVEPFCLSPMRIPSADLDTMQEQIGGRLQCRQAGPIGLQWHGHPVRFQNLRVRELSYRRSAFPRQALAALAAFSRVCGETRLR